MEKHRIRINVALCLALLIGVGLAARYLMVTRPEPPRRDLAALVQEVELHPVALTTFEAPVVGHGTVRAKSPLDIVPEVGGGALVYVNESLAVGKQIPKGELLFEIDAHSYRLRVSQADAEIRRLEAQLARQKQDGPNLEKRIAVAEDLLKQAEANTARERGLRDEGAATDVDVERAENSELRQRDIVLSYQAQLETIPHLIAQTQALIDLKKSQLEEANRQLKKTKIHCPFDARVEAIGAAESEVVIVGFAIATLTNMEALELAVGLEPSDLQWTRVWDYVRKEHEEQTVAPEASITWTVNDRAYTWRGRVARLERVDEITRTARVVIEIDDVRKEVTVGGQERPPLSVGMFCRVEIPAEPLANALVVPRSALHDPTDGSTHKLVYVFEPDDEADDDQCGRLVMRRVPVLRTVNELVLVSFDRTQVEADMPDVDLVSSPCDLKSGDEIIISPLPWAAEGMQLRRRGPVQVAHTPSSWHAGSHLLLGLADSAAPAMLGGREGVTGDD